MEAAQYVRDFAGEPLFRHREEFKKWDVKLIALIKQTEQEIPETISE